MFVWEKHPLHQDTLIFVHTSASGEETRVMPHEVSEYVAKLPASERQHPVPPFPLEESAAAVAADPEVRAAAETHPDSLQAAAHVALARAEACLLACESAVDECRSLVAKLDAAPLVILPKKE